MTVAAAVVAAADDGGGDLSSVPSWEQQPPSEPHSPFRRFSHVCYYFRNATSDLVAVAVVPAVDDVAVVVVAGQQQVSPSPSAAVGFYPEPQNCCCWPL